MKKQRKSFDARSVTRSLKDTNSFLIQFLIRPYSFLLRSLFHFYLFLTQFLLSCVS